MAIQSYYQTDTDISVSPISSMICVFYYVTVNLFNQQVVSDSRVCCLTSREVARYICLIFTKKYSSSTIFPEP